MYINCISHFFKESLIEYMFLAFKKAAAPIHTNTNTYIHTNTYMPLFDIEIKKTKNPFLSVAL